MYGIYFLVNEVNLVFHDFFYCKYFEHQYESIQNYLYIMHITCKYILLSSVKMNMNCKGFNQFLIN